MFCGFFEVITIRKKKNPNHPQGHGYYVRSIVYMECSREIQETLQQYERLAMNMHGPKHARSNMDPPYIDKETSNKSKIPYQNNMPSQFYKKRDVLWIL